MENNLCTSVLLTVQAVEIKRLPCVARLRHCGGSKLSRPWWILLSPELGHDSFKL